MENSIEETKKQLELILKVRKEQKEIIECAGGSCMNCDPDIKALTESIEILSDYKRVLKENEQLRTEVNSSKKEYETYKKQYFCLINRIENKIDKFDYEFEKAKRQNDKDKSDYYWDLIKNLKKLL